MTLYYKPEKNPGAKPEKRSRSAGPEIFLGFEIDLDFLKSGCRLKDWSSASKLLEKSDLNDNQLVLGLDLSIKDIANLEWGRGQKSLKSFD